MKNCIGVNPKAYTSDPEGRRLSPTPFLHYPDHCPYFKDAGKEGDCYKNCDELTSVERLCYRAAFGLDKEEQDTDLETTETVESQIERDESGDILMSVGEAQAESQVETGSTGDGSFIPEGFYFCTKCKKPHNPASKIGQKHQGFNQKPLQSARPVEVAKFPKTPGPVADTFREEIRAQVEQGSLIILEKHVDVVSQELDQMRGIIKFLRENRNGSTE